MIFFVANDGSVIKTLPSPVYQGSANANNIYLVAPFASNLAATVAFRFPNGVWTEPYLMTAQGVIAAPNGEVINEQTGKNYAVWTFSMPNEITRYYGTVTAQFFFYAVDGKSIIATSAASFTVGRGVPAQLPDTPSESVYEKILAAISALQTDLDNGAYPARAFVSWNPTYAYGANEYVFYPNFETYGAIVKSLVSNNRMPPFNESGNLNRAYWQMVFDFNQLRRAIVTWGFNEPSLISELKWEVA